MSDYVARRIFSHKGVPLVRLHGEKWISDASLFSFGDKVRVKKVKSKKTGRKALLVTAQKCAFSEVWKEVV